MKKILKHPVVDTIVTFIIAYILMYKTWIVGDFLIIILPDKLGIDLSSIMGEDLYYTWFTYIEFICIWICGLIIISAIRYYRPLLKAFSPKLKGNNLKSAIIGGVFLGFGLNMIVALAAIATGALQMHYVGLNFGVFVLLFISVMIQSGAEELVARVFIYQNLRRIFPKWPVIAILGNGVFFLIIHIGIPGMTVSSIIIMVLVSIMYSLVVYYYDSIWIPIVAHTTWNFTQSIILGLPNSGLALPVSMFKLDAGAKNFAYDPVFGIEGSILAVVIFAITSAGIYYFGRQKGSIETNIWNEEA